MYRITRAASSAERRVIAKGLPASPGAACGKAVFDADTAKILASEFGWSVEDVAVSEADTLAKQINSGALPINLKVISQKQVSATLGSQALHDGITAGIIGLNLTAPIVFAQRANAVMQAQDDNFHTDLFLPLLDKVGELVGTQPIRDMGTLKQVVDEEDIVVAVLAVPTAAAQPLAADLVAAGVKIIFNYSERLLQVPPDVTVHTSSPAVDLLYALYFYLA